MILEQETFDTFGYYPSKLKPHSHTPILAACDKCSKVRETSKVLYRALCHSCATKGIIFTEEVKAKMSAARKGKTFTEEHKRNMSAAQKGEKGSNWQGGISFEPYCVKFNNDYKREVRKLFSNKCFLRGKSEFKNGYNLDVHHVNYNKQCGCDDTKCIYVPLCHSCHAKTNYNRKYWEKKIKNKLKETLLGY